MPIGILELQCTSRLSEYAMITSLATCIQPKPCVDFDISCNAVFDALVNLVVMNTGPHVLSHNNGPRLFIQESSDKI